MALESLVLVLLHDNKCIRKCRDKILGRAWAAFGLHGTEFASAYDLINADESK